MGPTKEPLLGARVAAAVDDRLGAVAGALADERNNAIAAGCGDDGAHLHGGIEAVADLERCGGGGDGFAEPVLRFADGDRDADGEAALTGAAEGGVGNDLSGGFGIGVGQNDDMVFGAALALHALSARGAARVDVFCNRRRADEADGAHERMVEQCVDCGLAAVDEIDDAGGQAGFVDQFDKTRRGERNAIARLEHHGIAGSDGVGKEPERDHERKIEGRDDGADAERLAHHDFVDAGRNIFERVALHEHGDAAGDFDVFNAAAEFAFRFGEGLSVFGGDDCRQLIEVRFKKILELEEELDAIAGRRGAPGRRMPIALPGRRRRLQRPSRQGIGRAAPRWRDW